MGRYTLDICRICRRGKIKKIIEFKVVDAYFLEGSHYTTHLLNENG